MGDRAVILFRQGTRDQAAVYLHRGGSEVREILERFFRDEDANTFHDNRFDDPEYLAARFVVAQSDRLGTGIGIVSTTVASESNWRVHCDNDKHPRIERLDV